MPGFRRGTALPKNIKQACGRPRARRGGVDYQPTNEARSLKTHINETGADEQSDPVFCAYTP